MSRRIEVELTSSRADGVWTWRAAGARQPKGELDGSLLYEGAKVGDIVRADADFDIEGIAVTAVLPPKGARAKAEVLEILGSGRKDEPLVTSVLAPKSGRKSRDSWGDDRGPRRDGGNRDGRDSRAPRNDRPGGDRPGSGRPGGDRPGGGRPGGDRPGGGRPGGDRPGGGRPGGDRPRTGDDRREHASRPPRAPRPPVDVKPKARRLKPGRTYRQALLNALPETHRPLADLLMRGGIPNVRQALDRQNALLKGDDKPQIQPEPLLDMAERLMPSVRTAEWRDKAEAALAAGDDVDIRDLRSVVVAADDAARDEQSRQLAEQLRAAVTARVDREHQAWLGEIDEDLKGGRLVRALRLSSRPPKAGAPFPADLGHRLSEATTAGLAGDITSDRFATLLEALAVSPIRLQVVAASIPANPSPELLTAVRKSATRLPQIAKQFGIEATPGGSGPRPPRANKPIPPKPLPPKPIPPKPELSVDSTAVTEAPVAPAPEPVAPLPEPVANSTVASTADVKTEAEANAPQNPPIDSAVPPAIEASSPNEETPTAD